MTKSSHTVFSFSPLFPKHTHTHRQAGRKETSPVTPAPTSNRAQNEPEAEKVEAPEQLPSTIHTHRLYLAVVHSSPHLLAHPLARSQFYIYLSSYLSIYHNTTHTTQPQPKIQDLATHRTSQPSRNSEPISDSLPAHHTLRASPSPKSSKCVNTRPQNYKEKKGLGKKKKRDRQGSSAVELLEIAQTRFQCIVDFQVLLDSCSVCCMLYVVHNGFLVFPSFVFCTCMCIHEYIRELYLRKAPKKGFRKKRNRKKMEINRLIYRELQCFFDLCVYVSSFFGFGRCGF